MLAEISNKKLYKISHVYEKQLYFLYIINKYEILELQGYKLHRIPNGQNVSCWGEPERVPHIQVEKRFYLYVCIFLFFS